MEPAAAKQFLISRVVEQAQIEGVQLSDVEKKMLHFTEAHPMLPDISAVNEEFEPTYDDSKYEAKIARLLRNARSRDSSDSPSRKPQWEEALDALRYEDHYILVMAHQAFGRGTAIRNKSRLRAFLIYIAIGVGLVLSHLSYLFCAPITEHAMIPVHEAARGVSFSIRVHPRAKKNAITGEIGDALKISLTSPPTDGRANQACIEFFAKLLKVRQSSVTIASGLSSRNKVIRVAGMSVEQVRKSLS